MKRLAILTLLLPLAGCIDLFEGLWYTTAPLDREYEWPEWGEIPDEFLTEPYEFASSDAAGEDEVPILWGYWALQCLTDSDDSCAPSDHPERQRTVVLYFHGNHHSLEPYYDRVQILWKMGFTVFSFDYRGFGRSGGTPSEEGLYADSRAALDQVVQRLTADLAEDATVPTPAQLGIEYYGYSLGSALAVQLGTEQEPAALITEAALSGAQAFLDDAAGLGLDASVLMDTRFDSISKISDIAAPKLIMHGTDDDFVRYEFSELLYEHAVAPRQFFRVEGAVHHTVPCPDRDPELSSYDTPCVANEAYLETVGTFMTERLQ